jgi:hypothetical protein
MIFRLPPPEAAVDQGDIIDGCPLFGIVDFDPANPEAADAAQSISRFIVLTQACDLANQKVSHVVVAVVLDANSLVMSGQLKAADIRGSIRAGRVFGWYFLPKSDQLGLQEMIVDLRQLHTDPIDLLTTLCRSGKRRARVEPLYREHLNKHFANSYDRIGLPEPYETK